MPSFCPYAKLSVGSKASSSEIQQSFNKLCLKFHAANVVNPKLKAEFEVYFKEISACYALLANQVTRKVFDYHVSLMTSLTRKDYSEAWNAADKWINKEDKFKGSPLANIIAQPQEDLSVQMLPGGQGINKRENPKTKMDQTTKIRTIELVDLHQEELVTDLQNAIDNLTKELPAVSAILNESIKRNLETRHQLNGIELRLAQVQKQLKELKQPPAISGDKVIGDRNMEANEEIMDLCTGRKRRRESTERVIDTSVCTCKI